MTEKPSAREARMFGMVLDDLADGVRGYVEEHDGEQWIPLIVATSPGTGQVAAFLDRLPATETIVVPNVLSPKLARMLERRGFRKEVRWIGEAIDVWARPARPIE